MPFKKYKETHAGRGPMESAYAQATGGQGIFGRLGLKQERELTDQLIADISSQDEFRGLAGLIEVGRSPMTREQHAEFRANVTQAALDTRVYNAGLADFQERMKTARAQAVSKEDNLALDNFEMLANHSQRLASVGRNDKASEIFGSVLQNFGAYVQRNEEQRLELESSEAAGRETIRQEIQGELNTRLLAPMIEDEANYRSLLAQLKDGAGDADAPNALTSAVFGYVGAQLRGSDDGNWSFSIGPLGLSDAAVPTMTYSQLRNQLTAAFQGRNEFMRGQVAQYGEQALKRGFAINGAGVDDIYLPLANAAYRAKEAESVPQAPTAEETQTKAEKASDTAENVLAGIGRGAFPNFVQGVSDTLSYFFDPNADAGKPDLSRLPVNGDPPPRRPRRFRRPPPPDNLGQIQGVYVPPFLRGKFQ